jgi:hypothetical protein
LLRSLRIMPSQKQHFSFSCWVSIGYMRGSSSKITVHKYAHFLFSFKYSITEKCGKWLNFFLLSSAH